MTLTPPLTLTHGRQVKDLKTRLESRRTDPRCFAAVETGFYRGKTSRIRSMTF
jgi:hypothetical protein